MTAVSNTSPLNYLLLIGEVRVLPALTQAGPLGELLRNTKESFCAA